MVFTSSFFVGSSPSSCACVSHAPLHPFGQKRVCARQQQCSTEGGRKLLLTYSFCLCLPWASCAITRLAEAVIERCSWCQEPLQIHPFPRGDFNIITDTRRHRDPHRDTLTQYRPRPSPRYGTGPVRERAAGPRPH